MKGQQTTPAPAHLTQPSKATSQQIQHFNGELWWIAAKNLCLTWRERGRIRSISYRRLWPTTVRLWQHICFQPHLGRGQGVQIHGRPLLQISGQTTWKGSKQHQHQHIWHNHPKQQVNKFNISMVNYGELLPRIFAWLDGNEVASETLAIGDCGRPRSDCDSTFASNPTWAVGKVCKFMVGLCCRIWSNYMNGQQTTPAPAHMTQPSKATSQQIQHFIGELWWIAAKHLCLTWRERGRIRNISHRRLWPTTVRLWQHICFQPHLGRGQGVQIHGRPLLQISGQTTWMGSKQHQHQDIWDKQRKPQVNSQHFNGELWWIAAKHLCLTWRERRYVRNIRRAKWDRWPTTVRLWRNADVGRCSFFCLLIWWSVP